MNDASTRDGIIIRCIAIGRVNTLLYSGHCVCIADVHHAHHTCGDQFHHVHPATEFHVVAYDTDTATQAVHAAPSHDVSHVAHTLHHSTGQHVLVLNAVAAAHAVAPDAFPQLFPFLAIFDVPVRVNVHRTYIAYPSGFNVTPVLTVRLL